MLLLGGRLVKLGKGRGCSESLLAVPIILLALTCIGMLRLIINVCHNFPPTQTVIIFGRCTKYTLSKYDRHTFVNALII